MINLELLRIFTIVANENSITRASEKLNISQPAVTKHIKNLESQLHTILFDRNNKMELTDKGKKLFSELKPLIYKLERIEENFENNSDIILGTYSTMMSKVLSNCILTYYNKYKNNKIITVNDSINEMFTKLQNGELDLIISKKMDESLYDNKEILFIELGILEDVLIKNTNSKENDIINWSDINNKIVYIPRNDSLSITNFLSTLEKNNIYPIIKKVDSATMIELIKNSSDIGFITKEYIADEIKAENIKVINLESFNTEFGIYVKKENRFKELNHFIKILKDNF